MSSRRLSIAFTGGLFLVMAWALWEASAWEFCTLDSRGWGRPEVEMVFLMSSAPEYWSA